jgi:tetratricopeptide (TPR) repeat protein
VSSDAERALHRTDALLETERYGEAISVLHQALAAEPEDADLLTQLSIALNYEERYVESLSTAERALAFDPDIERARQVRTSCLWHLGRRAAALEAAREAAEYEPWSVKAWFDVAWLAAEHGHLEEARAAAAEAIELDPDDPDAWRAAAYAGFGSGSSVGLQELRHALSLQPNDWIFHNDLAWGLMRQGRFEEAELFARQAVEIDPTLHISLYNLATCLRWIGRTDEARHVLNRARDTAKSRIQRRLAADPDDAGAHVELGAQIWYEGRHEEALQEFQTAVKLAEDHFGGWSWIALTELTLERFDEAKKALERALELEPGAQVALVIASELAHRVGDTARAAEAAHQLAAQFPGSLYAEEAFGVAALAAGDYDEALARLSAVLDRHAVRCCAYGDVGVAKLRLGDFAGAKEAYERLLLSSPDCNCFSMRELRSALETEEIESSTEDPR